MPELRKDLHECNRLSWNEATTAHNSHKIRQAEFLRNGGSTLFPEEISLLGSIRGLTLAHLQCNSGQDSLSLTALGARVTGVDISDTAIQFAQDLSRDSGLEAQFIRTDLFDWFEDAAASGLQFDRVFASYGTVCWLSGLRLWAEGISRILKPQGSFVLVDFHPLAMVFNEDLQLTYSYFGNGTGERDQTGVNDYVALSGNALAPSGFTQGTRDFRNPHPSWYFAWGIGEIVTALLGAGLQLDVFHEWPWSNGFRPFQHMELAGTNRYRLPSSQPALPLMYGLRAVR